ncbi:MAG: transcription antitermination protein NusB [Saprospiraceae bacterium]|nr:transcription antitermination protein NusB [Saprospiraceae bacterium]
MLSRRSVRVKVMQLLYTVSRDESLNYEQALKQYWKNIDESYELFLFNIYNITQIAKVSTEDKEKRKAKHLPTEIDKKFTAKLWDNVMIQDIVKNKALTAKFESYKFSSKSDRDHYKTIYYEFAKEESYIHFLINDTTHDENLELLLDLFRFCRKNELYNEILEDNYANWEDDKSLIIGAIKKVLKELPAEEEKFYLAHYPDKETTKDYGEFLFIKTFQEDKALLDLIEPVLKNWDADRVAVLDMIMLKMAICEFCYCPTIPAKVTINEYVEVAKNYSTAKSKEFINGILDKLLEQLLQQGKIVKEGRGLLDE